MKSEISPAKIFLDLSAAAQKRLYEIAVENDGWAFQEGLDDPTFEELLDAKLIESDYSYEGPEVGYVGGTQLTKLGKRVSAFVMFPKGQLPIAEYASFRLQLEIGEEIDPDFIKSMMDEDAKTNGGIYPKDDDVTQIIAGEGDEELVDKFPSLVKLLSEV